MKDYRSAQDRPIDFHVFGDGPKTIMVMAGVHGDETNGVDIVRSLLAQFTHHSSLITDRLVILPLANPDGYEAGTRWNANKIDLNRNFPTKDFGVRPTKKKFFGGKTAASEPETQAIMDIVRTYKPRLIISLHESLACVNYNGACVRIARRIANATDLPAVGDIGYPCPGSMGTYYGAEGRVPVITLELPKGDFDRSLFSNAILDVLGLARIIHEVRE